MAGFGCDERTVADWERRAGAHCQAVHEAVVQQGQVEMDIGENLDWIGHAIIDAEMRLICGLPPVKDPKIPFYIFDKSNAHRAGNPPELSKGYGDAYIDGYLKLWRLK